MRYIGRGATANNDTNVIAGEHFHFKYDGASSGMYRSFASS